jgi:hypothetical protein
MTQLGEDFETLRPGLLRLAYRQLDSPQPTLQPTSCARRAVEARLP